MRLRFVLGRAGTGKTHSALEAIRTELKRRPDGSPLVLLTPEQATFQMERALLMNGDVRAAHRAQVLSFERLAARVMQETGGGARPRLGDLGKRMVLRALIQEHGDRLKLFGRAARQPGFVDKLAQTLSELRQYRIGPDDLAERAEKAASDADVLAAKLHDLSVIYNTFTDYVRDRFTDPDELLNEVALALPESALLAGAHVWVDGFSGFTPQEFAVLRAMWRTVARMDIALCLDLEKGGDLFSPTRETYERLLHMAAEERVIVEPPIVLSETPPARFRSVPLLAHLERELFRRPGRTFEGASEDDAAQQLQIVAAANPRTEVEAAARHILRLCHERGWRYRDIAVIVRQLQPYEDLIAAVFADYGIPYFIDSRRQLSHHPLVELVRSALEAATGGQRTEALMRCFKTDFFPVSRDDVDKLENYALEHGIDGRGWMQTGPWRYVRRFTLEPEEYRPTAEQSQKLDEINRIRDAAVAPLRKFRGALQQAERGKDMAAALWDLLEELDVSGTLEQWMEAADAEDRPDEVQEHLRAWQGMMQVLDEFVTALGGTALTKAEFRQIIEAGLETLRVGMVPPGLDQVMVGSVERSRQPDIRAALVLGAGDGHFPPAPTEDVIFTDAEREQLAASGVQLSPTSREELLREQYLLYVSLTRAGEHVWISYATADNLGKEQAPSAIVRRMATLFPQVPVQSAPVEPTSDEALLDRIADVDGLAATVAGRLRRHRAGEAAGPIWWDLYDWIAGDDTMRARARSMFAALNHHNAVPPLQQSVAGPLFGTSVHGSVTRLESFAECAFKHFSRYGLRLRERARWVLDGAQTGTFMHAALKLFVERLAEDDLDWGELTDDEALARADACVADLVPYLGNEILLSSARHAFLADVMRRTVRRAVWLLTEHARRGKFRPLFVELAFGRGAEAIKPLVIPLTRGGALWLSGQIDRIDFADDGGDTWVRIIDYKSSRRDVDLVEVVHGLSLQLPLYLAVVVQMAEDGHLPVGGTVHPAAIVYFPVREPFIRKDELISHERLDTMLRRELRMRGLFIDEPEALRLLADDVDGTSDLVTVSVTKRGTVDKRSNTTDAEGFAALIQFAKLRAQELGDRIVSGEIAVAPFSLGQKTACQYCPFRSVCQFDPLVEGNGYRELDGLDRNEAWQIIREAGS